MKRFTRSFLESAGWIPRTQIVAKVSPDYPEAGTMPRGLLHVVGGPGYHKWAYLKCPCPCGQPIMLSLSETRRPSWKVSIDWLDRPTLYPSVWQTHGCHSHFWLRRGQVEWVRDTGTRPPKTRG